MSSKRSKPKSKKKKKKKPKFMSLNDHHQHHHQVIVAEPEENDPQVASLLEDTTEPNCMPTITDLFASSSTSSSSVLSPASPSIEWDDGLAWRALRGREKWEHQHKYQHQQQLGLLQLKLDYDEVMTAWSDRGPLYIDGVVPELCQDHNVFVEVGTVPEMEVKEKKKKMLVMNREERVMRYKAKRQSRLFSKRIRYEVRKLNAEKRPRIKGRFVKRIDDM